MPFTLTTFGGELPKQHVRNLPGAFAALALDVNLDESILAPWRTDQLVRPITQAIRTLFNEDCELQAYPQCANVVRQSLPCLRYYRTGIAGYPEQAAAPGGPYTRLGMPPIYRPPAVALLDTSQGIPQTTDKVIDRMYLYTLVDTLGNESQGSEASSSLVCDWDAPVLVSGFSVPLDYPIKSIRIYTTQPGLQDDTSEKSDVNSFFLIDEIPVSQVSYIHRPVQTALGDVYMNLGYYEPPTDLAHLQSWGTSQMAGLAGDRLMFSVPNQPHAWPIDYAIGFFSKPVTWVATPGVGYVLTCGKPEVVDLRFDPNGKKAREVERIDEELPCIGPLSACAHDKGAIYASTDGLVMLTGTRAQVLTASIFTKQQWLAIHPNTLRGVVHDGYYFGATDNYCFRLRVPDQAYEVDKDNLITQLSIRPTAWYRSLDDRLYFADANGIWEWNAGDRYKPYTWRSGIEEVDQRRALGACEIEIDGDCGMVIFNRGREVFRRDYSGGGAFRLPSWVKGDGLQVQLTGTGRISRVKLGASKGVLSALK